MLILYYIILLNNIISPYPGTNVLKFCTLSQSNDKNDTNLLLILISCIAKFDTLGLKGHHIYLDMNFWSW